MMAMVRARLGKVSKEEKGFTLIELLAVIVILGIIAVIAIPMIGNIIDKSRSNADLATGRQMYEAARLYVIGENAGEFINSKVSLSDMQTKGYLESSLYLPSSKMEITSAEVQFDANGVLSKVIIVPAPKESSAEAVGGSYSKDQILSSEVTPVAKP